MIALPMDTPHALGKNVQSLEGVVPLGGNSRAAPAPLSALAPPPPSALARAPAPGASLAGSRDVQELNTDLETIAGQILTPNPGVNTVSRVEGGLGLAEPPREAPRGPSFEEQLHQAENIRREFGSDVAKAFTARTLNTIGQMPAAAVNIGLKSKEIVQSLWNPEEAARDREARLEKVRSYEELPTFDDMAQGVSTGLKEAFVGFVDPAKKVDMQRERRELEEGGLNEKVTTEEALGEKIPTEEALNEKALGEKALAGQIPGFGPGPNPLQETFAPLSDQAADLQQVSAEAALSDKTATPDKTAIPDKAIVSDKPAAKFENSLTERRARELEGLGGSRGGLTEQQVTKAWRGKMKQVNDAGLSSIVLRSAISKKRAGLEETEATRVRGAEEALAKAKESQNPAAIEKAQAAATPRKISEEGLFQGVKKELLEKRITDKYSKYSWHNRPLKEGRKVTRREQEWRAFKQLKANPRIDESQFVKKDGFLDFEGAGQAVRKDQAALVEDARVRGNAKGASGLTSDQTKREYTEAQTKYTLERTEYSKAARDSLKDPATLSPQQRDTQLGRAFAASAELSKLQKADEAGYEKYRGSLTLQESDGEQAVAKAWARELRAGDVWVKKIEKDGSQALNALLADSKSSALVKDYVRVRTIAEREID